MYVHAIDALYLSGDGERTGVIAEEAYRCFADDPDPATAAVIRHRAAFQRAIDAPADALPLIEDALRLYEQAPPSADHAMARLDHADVLLHFARAWNQPSVPALLNRALEIAEAAAATAAIPRILAFSAEDAFLRGQIEDGFAYLERGWALAHVSQDVPALLWLAVSESSAQLKLARFSSVAEVALRGLGHARQVGLEASFSATILAYNGAVALLARGRTAEAAALIDPLTAGAPDRLHLLVHETRAEIDLLRGDIDAAAGRRQLIDAIFAHVGNVEFAIESAPRAVELALWAGRPSDALATARRVLPLLKTPDLAIVSGRLLAAGMRACADLAEQARARRDEPAAETATTAADDLASWAGQAPGAPFADHPFVATIPAERATWDAERTRLAGASDPQAWRGAAKAWQDLGCPHRAGYAWWRQAQAHLDAGQAATMAAAALRAAAAAADGHAPLLAQVRLLAERARIPLQPPAAGVTEAPSRAPARAPYGLTGRELAVLRLLAAGRTNAQIGAELYISPSTASVHVTSILRKLGVSSRVQAAAIAERAGLLHQGQP
jgi:DNA-binding CsgD family transcriptional regulator